MLILTSLVVKATFSSHCLLIYANIKLVTPNK